MKKRCALLVLTFAAAVQAQPAPQKPDAKVNPQNERMAICNKQASGQKGEERKAFMSQCLSSNKITPQDRMKACNRQATGKTGEERKSFMSSCLKAG